MAFGDWSTNADSNGTTLGVQITEGATPVSNVNNALRSIMAQLRSAFSTSLSSFFAGTSALPVANGGTGGTTAAAARSGLGSAASGANSDITSLTGLTTALAVAYGGTGAATAAAARANLGAIGITASSLASPGYIKINISGTDFIIQWGTGTATANTASQTVNYPTAFSSFSIPIVSGGLGIVTADENYAAVTSAGTSSFTISTSYGTGHSFWWIAVGV